MGCRLDLFEVGLFTDFGFCGWILIGSWVWVLVFTLCLVVLLLLGFLLVWCLLSFLRADTVFGLCCGRVVCCVWSFACLDSVGLECLLHVDFVLC